MSTLITKHIIRLIEEGKLEEAEQEINSFIAEPLSEEEKAEANMTRLTLSLALLNEVRSVYCDELRGVLGDLAFITQHEKAGEEEVHLAQARLKLE